MLYIVEIPHQMPVQVWTANDKKDFCARVQAFTQDVIIYDEMNLGELRRDVDEDAVDAVVGHLANQPDDVTVYRTWGNDKYTLHDTGEFYACHDYLRERNHSCLIYNSSEDALEALANDFVWEGHQGAKARNLLRRALKREGEMPPHITRYIMDDATKIPLDDSYHDREIILAAGFDPNDDEYTVSDLTDEWSGHPAGSHAVIGMTAEGHPFAIVEDWEAAS